MSITTSRVFQDSWLEEEFKSWLRQSIVCNKKLSLSTSRCAVKEHARGNKHIKIVTKRKNVTKNAISLSL